MEWKSSLSVGNEFIDEQHKELIKNIDKLRTVTVDKDGIEAVSNILTFVEEYTIKHFSDEEKLLREVNYPEYDAHKEIHDNFRAEVRETIQNIEDNGFKRNDISLFGIKLITWIIAHIMKEDKKYSTYIK